MSARRYNSTLPRRRQQEYDASERYASEENLEQIEDSGRWALLSKNIKHAVADFFGVADDDEEETRQLKWKERSMKMHSKNTIIGKAIPRGALHDAKESHPLRTSTMIDDTDAAIEMTSYTPSREAQTYAVSAPASLAAPHDVAVRERGPPSVEIRPRRQISWASSSRSKLVRKPSASVAGGEVLVPVPTYAKDDVWKMAFDGVKRRISTRRQPAAKPQRSMMQHKSIRSVPRNQVNQAATLPRSFQLRDEPQSLRSLDEIDSSIIGDISFFDSPQSTSVGASRGRQAPRRSQTLPVSSHTDRPLPRVLAPPPGQRHSRRPEEDVMEELVEEMEEPQIDDVDNIVAGSPEIDRTGVLKDSGLKHISLVGPVGKVPAGEVDEVDGFAGEMKRIPEAFLDEIVTNGPKRRLGEGIAAQVLGWERKEDLDPELQRKLDKLEADMHRPYFTYWVTFVQIVCFIVAVCVSGISTIGVHTTVIRAEVKSFNLNYALGRRAHSILTTSLGLEYVDRTEIDNMWIGPRQADLIHMGARYTLCMRPDSNLEAVLKNDVNKERDTACCVRNDGSGAVQTNKCSASLSTWLKWNGSDIFQNRKSGSVCGQDPRLCTKPASQEPFSWPDDITQWPICKETSDNVPKKDEYRNMQYDVVGRPCCFGIQGQCEIVTREHCTFLRGYFHEEAALCSQVNCLDEICGMIPFWDPQVPDQFYRLFTSLFIHAGVIELVLTVVVQILIMRDLEKLAGWLRICIIYIVSGMGGSLASALLVPYHVEAGPSGCQFGLLACLLVEVVHNWNIISDPAWALGKLICVTLICLILGFLPLVDNIAHLFGFVFGFLLSFALLPYVTFKVVDKTQKLIGIIFCLTFCVLVFVALVLIFYLAPVRSCYWCQYFNCIPFTETFCLNSEITIVRTDV